MEIPQRQSQVLQVQRPRASPVQVDERPCGGSHELGRLDQTFHGALVLVFTEEQQRQHAQQAADGDADGGAHRAGTVCDGQLRLRHRQPRVRHTETARETFDRSTEAEAGNIGDQIAQARCRHDRNAHHAPKCMVDSIACHDHDGVVHEAEADERNPCPQRHERKLLARRLQAFRGVCARERHRSLTGTGHPAPKLWHAQHSICVRIDATE
mmetsp:Transcript_8503/g.26685  ORF Transcript_8503/g.26685 Transcript_8503/m.26685 type:complete len:211 (-) Transcript_8503:241-873(-)